MCSTGMYLSVGVLYGSVQDGGGKLEQGSGGLWLTASCKDSQRGVACFSGCYDDDPGREVQLMGRREGQLR